MYKLFRLPGNLTGKRPVIRAVTVKQSWLETRPKFTSEGRLQVSAGNRIPSDNPVSYLSETPRANA